MKAALCVRPQHNPQKPAEPSGFLQRPAMEKKGFNRDAVDVVKQAIDAVIDPVLSEKQKVAIQPGSEDGMRRRKPAVKKIPAKKKRSAFL
jgi:hypothetical protein